LNVWSLAFSLYPVAVQAHQERSGNGQENDPGNDPGNFE
jgi:hypothetical protein